MPSPGYKSPLEVSGLHASGLKPVNISSADDVKRITKESEGIVISKTVGMKKRFEIFKKAKELQVQVLNLNVDEQLKKIEDNLNLKKKTDVKVAKAVKEPKETKTESIEKQGLSDEEKKQAIKKEKDKVLTKRI